MTALTLRCAACPFAVREALAKVTQWLATTGCDADCIGNVELALAEAMNNIVEHACADLEDAQIKLRACRQPDSLNVWLFDPGRAMIDPPAPAQVPVPDGPDAALPEGGFGWMLLHSLAESVSLRRRLQINRLHLRFGL